MNYKVTVFGVKDTTKIIVKYISENIGKVDLIVTIEDEVLKKNDIAGFEKLDDIADKYDIELFKVPSYSLKDKKTINFFSQNTFDIAISMGWQRLIPKSILDAFRFGVFGFHGSCAYLPFGKGRSPLNWSLLLGDKRFILNMFKYDENADSPNIFSKRMWEITDFDNIRTLQYKNLLCSKEQIKELLNAYNKGTITINTESKDFESWYSKRSSEDGRINFTWRTKKVYDLIRAVTKPFPGAFCFHKNSKVIIWDAVPFDMILDFSNYQVGEVIDVFEGNPVVRTLDGSMIIKKYDSVITLEPGLLLT